MERPLVRVNSRKNGVVDLHISPFGKLIEVRDAIDIQRTTSLNFVVPSAGDISLRLGYGISIESVLGEVADIEHVESPQDRTQ